MPLSSPFDRRIASLLALASVAAMGTVGIGVQREYTASLEAVGDSMHIRDAIAETLSLLKDAETGQRGYVLTGSEDFLLPYSQAGSALPAQVRTLKALTRATQAQAHRTTTIERLAREKMAELAETIELRRQGRADAALKIVQEGRGRRLMLALRSETRAMLASERARLTARQRAAEAGRHRLMIVTATVWTLFLGAVGWGTWSSARSARQERRINQRLRDNERALRAVADHATDLVCIVDVTGRLTYVSPSCERILGYSQEEMLAMEPHALLPEQDRDEARRLTEATVSGGVEQDSLTHRLCTKWGELRWFETRFGLIYGSGEGQALHLTSRDVTERRRQDAALQNEAQTMRTMSLRDDLTGLQNRRGFLELAGRQMHASTSEGRSVTVFFVDLNGLKAINDNLGHDAGDAAIVAAGRVLLSVFRDGDVVARLGGDEFAVFALDCGSEHVAGIRARLYRTTQEFNDAGDAPFRLSMSVGASSPAPGTQFDLSAVLEEADRVMYAEKRARAGQSLSKVPAIRAVKGSQLP